jgi:hypothetical protein
MAGAYNGEPRAGSAGLAIHDDELTDSADELLKIHSVPQVNPWLARLIECDLGLLGVHPYLVLSKFESE